MRRSAPSLLSACLTALIVCAPHRVLSQELGLIHGMVVDSESGESLPGAVVFVEGSDLGATVDIDGRYTLRLPPGVHALRSELIGYTARTVTGVRVEPGVAATMDFALEQQPIALGVTIEVTAEAMESAEAGLLRIQQKSDKITDGISAELMSKTSSSDAGEALKRVTGVTMVGKHAYVRGLGGRYGTALLNGAKVPSPEPNQGIVPMDVFPASLLDHVQIAKNFTPDLPGDFAGGCVQIVGKEYPEHLTLSFSSSSGMNSRTTAKDMYSYKGGGLDFLGIDDGTRAMPNLIKERASGERVTAEGENAQPEDPGFAPEELEVFGEAFRNAWTPRRRTAPLNQSYDFSLGNELPLGRDSKFGYVLALNYNNDHSTRAERQRVFTLGSGEQLEPKVDYDVDCTTNNVLWGGIFTGSFRVSPFHNISLKSMYNRNAEDEARVFTGWNDDRQKEWLDYRLRYIERSLLSTQLHGRHYFYQFLDSDLDWKVTYATVERNEPDNREVIYEAAGVDSAGMTNWQLFVNNSQSGSRHFYELDESQAGTSADWSVPFLSPAGLASKIKSGVSYESKDREFLVRRFRFVRRLPADIPWPPPEGFFIDLTQSPEDLFSPQHISADPSEDRFELTESTNYEDSYRATHDLLAGYISVDLFLNRWLRVIGGGRVETSRQELRLHNPLGLPYNPGVGDTLASLDNTDLLPSLGMVLRTGDRGNVRMAYGRTLARPDFRELAPYEFVNYVGGYAEKGNPHLKRTLIDNFDLRFEHFPNVGELLAVSLFYKYFRDPIEQVIQPTSQLRVSYDNADWARSLGIEFEFRKSLAFVVAWLSNFSLNANLALMDTEVKLPDRSDQIQTSKRRQLQGQSPYVVNTMLAYDNLSSGTSSTILVHTFGRRITDVGGQGIPDTYEEPRPQLDFVLKQRLLPRLTAKFSASNLLDPTYKWVQGGETRTEYQLGRSFSVGASYSL